MAVRVGNNKFVFGEDPVSSADINDTFDAARFGEYHFISGGVSSNTGTGTVKTIIPSQKFKYIYGMVKLYAVCSSNSTVNVTWFYTVTYEDNTTEDFTISTASRDNTNSGDIIIYCDVVEINKTLSKYATKVEFKITVSGNGSGSYLINTATPPVWSNKWVSEIQEYYDPRYSFVILS